MKKYRMEVEQTRVQNWTVEVEAESEEKARELVEYGFDEDHGFFYVDTDGLTVLEDSGVIGDFTGLKFLTTTEV